jgi:hypothetical protein
LVDVFANSGVFGYMLAPSGWRRLQRPAMHDLKVDLRNGLVELPRTMTANRKAAKAI